MRTKQQQVMLDLAERAVEVHLPDLVDTLNLDNFKFKWSGRTYLGDYRSSKPYLWVQVYQYSTGEQAVMIFDGEHTYKTEEIQ